MNKNRNLGDLFVPLVPLERLDSGFNYFRAWNGAEPARLMMNEVYREFPDKDGNFAEQFQTTGFDARTFELYLFAYLASHGFQINRDHPSPDFLVTCGGVACAIEATTVNPTGRTKLNRAEAPPALFDELTPEELQQKVEHDLPIRFGSPLKSKVDYRNAAGQAYWELEHCKGMPFVLAIEAFHEPQSLFFTDASLFRYLYGLKGVPRWTKEGKLYLDHLQVDRHQSGAKVIPSNFFGQPQTQNVSAVVFSNSGTWPKFNRMGYQAGYHRGNITVFRRGTCLSSDPDSATPEQFGYDLDFPPCEETWAQGLVVFHNPNAFHPLPPHFFPGAVTHYFADGEPTIDAPASSLLPFASITVICCVDDDFELDPANSARPGIRSIRLDEFEALRPPRRSRTLPTSQEKEWFASEDRRIVGTVALDLVDKDWMFVLFSSNSENALETEDLRCDIIDRMAARKELLDAMESALTRSDN
jgi:hypothetical protein